MSTKTDDSKRVLMFGDFIAAAYRVWGARRAKGFVRLYVNARLLEFRGRHRLVIADE